MPFDARGQIAIITGSAQGFGKEFAKRLLRKGAKVCLSDVNEEIGAQTLQELEKSYGAKNVTFKRCDVSQQNEWENIWTHTENHFEGKVSILINNAGVNPKHGWKATIDIMCFGVGLGTYMAIEKMGTSKGGRGGRIINIASMAGLVTGLGEITEAGYTVSKHGTVALTRSFKDCKPNVEFSEGIKAYAICPYFADTQLVRDAIAINDLEKKIKGRVLTIQEVGHALDVSLEKDLNGECYVVFPDVPVFRLPNVSRPLMGTFIAFGSIVGAPLNLEDFTVKHVALGALVLLFLLYLILSVLAWIFF